MTGQRKIPLRFNTEMNQCGVLAGEMKVMTSELHVCVVNTGGGRAVKPLPKQGLGDMPPGKTSLHNF